MTDRERFLATMHHQPAGRGMICDFGFWPETIVEWHKQGLPGWVTYDRYDSTHTDRYFGMDSYTGGGRSLNIGLCPDFGWTLIEDKVDHEIVRQHDGVTVLRKKFMGSIPEHQGHLLVDRASWNEHYKWRLDPKHPDRHPRDWTEFEHHFKTTPAKPSVAWAGSLYGWLRDWMGVEAISYLVYDEPELFEEMVVTLAELTLNALEQAFAHGARYDAASMWEDMCFNTGPLLSPPLFRQFLVPQYRRITSLLAKHGVDIVWLDCDGKIDELLEMWLDAGVNTMFPIEVGTWKADVISYRRRYGSRLKIIGGFDKHILADSFSAIEREVDRLAPLVEEGGFIPTPDHRVPPDVPLRNYQHYIRTARKVWGRDASDLKPIEF
jgi:uroporphyrinogen decarboxylase